MQEPGTLIHSAEDRPAVHAVAGVQCGVEAPAAGGVQRVGTHAGGQIITIRGSEPVERASRSVENRPDEPGPELRRKGTSREAHRLA